MINNETRVTINIVTLVGVISIILGGAWSLFQINANFEAALERLETKDTAIMIEVQRVERELCSDIDEINLINEKIILEQKENRSSNVEIKTKLASIETNLQWIVDTLKTK